MKKIQRILSQEVDPAFAKRADYIVRHIQRNKSKRVLDAGCGRGFYVRLLSMLPSVKKVEGIDINDEYVEKAKKLVENTKKASVKKGSIYELPFKDKTFDAVVCSEILEHLDDEETALKEIHRVLKPGGIFLVSVPHENFPFSWDPLNWILMRVFKTHVNKDIWWLAGIWADHVRLYKPNALRSTIKDAGFKVTYMKKYIHWCWPFTHFMLYAVGKNIVERLGSSEFDRFNFQKNRPLARFLAKFVALPSTLLDKRLPRKAAMNLVLTAKKQK